MHDYPINAEADRAYARLYACRAECARYRKALKNLVDVLHALDPDAALMPQVAEACEVLDAS